MTRVEIHAPEGLAPALAEWWRQAVSANATPPAGADMTTAPEWQMAVARAFLPQGGAKLLVAFEADRASAVLPLFQKPPGRWNALGRTIALLTDLYGGRSALLCQAQDPAATATALLRGLDEAFPDWSCLEMTLVDDHAPSVALLGALARRLSALEAEPLEPSPYIVLPARFEDYFNTLKPNFRTEVRRGERRLRETGNLTRELFTAPHETDRLWDLVCRIERESWKEAAGTSITTNAVQRDFYTEFLPAAAAAGQLLAAVLFLDDRPVAHQLCVQRDATAAILKMSYVEDIKRLYPATVLLAGYLQDIIERGVRYLDFMGVCDDFKMRWTQLIYGRTTHRLFRDSVAGRLSHARHRLARHLAARHAAREGVSASTTARAA